jgi:hypothetical protein
MTKHLTLHSLLANEEHVFSRVITGYNAKGALPKGEIRSQTLYAAAGAIIIKDLVKPIAEGRPLFH